MEISDFIPSYPYVENDDFNKQIYNLKEFHDIKTTNEKWKHQDLLARYAGSHTMFNKHLIFHTPGTGKTCTAVKIIEDIIKFRPDTRALIIVPNSMLADQWEKSITEICANYVPLYFKLDIETLNKLSYEKLVEIYSDILGSDVFVEQQQTTESLINDIINEIPDLSEATKKRRTRKLMEKYYSIVTKDTFGNYLKAKRDISSYLVTNSIIVIDEAHNLKDEAGYYDVYYKFLHETKGKILLLTGTPMQDSSNQISGLLNLILNKEDNIKHFNRDYMSDGKMIKEKADELEKKIRGTVSYITGGENLPKRVNVGEIWTDVTRYIKVHKKKMDKLQQKGYEKAYKLDTKEPADKKTAGLYMNSTAAINFVYKNNEDYLWGEQASTLLSTESSIKKNYINDIKNNIEKYSSKLKQIIEIAKTKEQIFVFNEYVKGAHGCIFQANVLRLFGIKVGIIVGSATTAQNKNTLNMFQNKSIQVLIGSRTIAEGTSLTNVKHTISVSPWWNIAQTEQALTRAIRADSKNRTIFAYQLAADSDNIEDNIDAIRFKTAEGKDVAIKSVERFLKKVAWDCKLNYDRNYIDAEDYSMQCDYEKCKWKCYGSPKFDRENTDNWILFYSEASKKQLEEQIKKQFQQKSVIYLKDIKVDNGEEIQNTTEKLILLILEEYIKKNKKVLNKWGIECYIRYSGEVLYLSNNLSNEQLSDVWYTDKLYVNNHTELKNVINDDIISSDTKKIKKLDAETISSLHPITQAKILEYAYQRKATKILDVYKAQAKFFEFGDFGDKVVYKIDDMFKVYDSGWRDCDKKTECNKYNAEIKKKDLVTKSEQKYDMYAIKKNNELFLVTDPKNEKSTGRKCDNFKKYELIKQFINKKGLLKEMNSHLEKVPEVSKQKMIDSLDAKIEYNESFSDQLQYIYNINNLTMGKICAVLEHVFGLKK
jgi:superfamily II DNA or RNA helicase